MSEVNERWVADGCPPPLAVNAVDGSVLVYVPGGEFEMGDGQDGNCPQHRVDVRGYYIGICCVTNRQYAAFVKATKHQAPDKDYWSVWKSGRCPEERLNHPVVCVSWDDATAYAEWAGLDLPTEAQWEKAARGPKGLVYPWGNEWDAGTCRNATNKGSGQTCRVWEYAAGVSGYGTYNQSGNVWEWCRDWYGSRYYGTSPAKDPTGPKEGSRRVRRGGSWCYDVASYFRGAYRSFLSPDCRDFNLGFRLVRTAS